MIVRELLAKLGFQVDNKPLKEFKGNVESAKSMMLRFLGVSGRSRDELGRFTKQVKFGGLELKDYAKRFDDVILKAAKWGTLAAGGLVALTVKTAASFEKLGASLKTVTGSADAANVAMDRIKRFAKDTPFSVEEVGQAFVKLKALGLDPGEAALRSYGNTASAMGYSLNQMVEAVADAITGEFERLKEFGIKAKTEGDQVTFTFQGVSTTVGKNAAEIERYLRTIGDVNFADAMADQMSTFGASISNLKDAFDALLLSAAEGGLLTVFKEITAELREMVEGGGDLAKQMGGSVANGVRAAWTAFKRLLPSLQAIAESMANDLIPFAVELVEGLVSVSDALGGLDNTAMAAIGGLTALRLAALGATSPWAALATAVAAAGFVIGKTATDMLLNTSAIEAQIEGLRASIRALKAEAAEIRERRMKDEEDIEEIEGRIQARRRGETEGLDPSLIREDEFPTSTGRSINRGISKRISERAQRHARDVERRLRKQGVGAVEAHNRAQLAAVAMTRDLSGKIVDARVAASEAFIGGGGVDEVGTAIDKTLDGKKKKGRGGGRKKAKKTKAAKPELTVEEMLERDFGAGLGDPGRASGVRPSLGTTINKITNEFSPNVTQQFSVSQQAGEDGDTFAQRVAEISRREIDSLFRTANDHFLGAVTG